MLRQSSLARPSPASDDRQPGNGWLMIDDWWLVVGGGNGLIGGSGGGASGR